MANCFPDEFPLLTTQRVFWKGVFGGVAVVYQGKEVAATGSQ